MRRFLLPVIVSMLFVFVTLPVHAAAAAAPNLPLEALQTTVSDLYSYSLKIVGLAVFIMFLIAGLSYMIPALQKIIGADPMDIIKDAIIGMVLLFSAYLILNTINPDLVGGSSATGATGNFVELAPPSQNILQQPTQPENFVQTTAPTPNFFTP